MSSSLEFGPGHTGRRKRNCPPVVRYFAGVAVVQFPSMEAQRSDVEQRRLMVRRSLDGTIVDEFRADVEGLRALAVIVVVLFHAKVTAFAGGFVGVDVFFVLSGFLITSLLLRELSTTGTVSLSNFWARRARRLLPASGLVIVVTLIASRFMLDGLSQGDLARDAIAACLFVANIRF